MKKFRIRFLVFPVLAVGALALMSGLVMVLWNWLIPTIFGLTIITFWQALGLFVLSKLLFSGFGGGRRFRRSGWRPGGAINDKWRNMTPDERREFMKNRCNSGFGRFGKGHPFFTDVDKTEKESGNG